MRRKAHPLYRRVVERELLPIATFDIETEPIGTDMTFLDSCVYYGDTEYHHLSSADDLVSWFFAHPGYRYYAHNGAGFDFSYIIDILVDYADEYDIDPIIQGQSRIIGIIVKKGRKFRFELRDSMAIIAMSLDRAAEIYAPQYRKQDIGLGSGHVYNPLDTVDIAYLHNDVLSLFEVLTNFETEIFRLFGVTIGFTSGSTAIKAWCAHIPNGHAYYRCNERVEQFCRAGYYGGYVYPGRSINIHKDAKAVDMNAAYAAAMRKGVPYGTCTHTGMGEYFYDRPGMYRVIAHVPQDVLLPAIPSRDAHKNLRWATGNYETIVTSLEIEFSRNRLGCSFEILEGYTWDTLEYPFQEFLALTEELELSHGGAVKQISKDMRNCLYGKFGSKELVKKVVFLGGRDMEDGESPLVIEETGDINPYIAFTLEEASAEYIMPHWAAWITAAQRVALMTLFLDVGVEYVYYGDTDCCIGDSERIDAMVKAGELTISTKYGDVKVEQTFQFFQSLGPKNYHGITQEGTYTGKVKGIPRKLLDRLLYDLYKASDFKVAPPVEFYSVTNAMSKLKYPQKPFCEKRTRKLSNIGNSMAWNLKGNKIIPLHILENVA